MRRNPGRRWAPFPGLDKSLPVCCKFIGTGEGVVGLEQRVVGGLSKEKDEIIEP